MVSNGSRLNELLDIFDKESSDASVTPLERLQSKFMRSWFQENNVATVELLQWSRGIINPVANKSYVSMLGGILVSMRSFGRDLCSHVVM